MNSSMTVFMKRCMIRAAHVLLVAYWMALGPRRVVGLNPTAALRWCGVCMLYLYGIGFLLVLQSLPIVQNHPQLCKLVSLNRSKYIMLGL